VRRSRALTGVMVGALLWFVVPAPTFADNCSNAADCASTADILLWLAIGILIAILIIFVATELAAGAAAVEIAAEAGGAAADVATEAGGLATDIATDAAEGAAGDAATAEAAGDAAEVGAGEGGAASEPTTETYGPKDPRSWADVVNQGDGETNCVDVSKSIADAIETDTIPANVDSTADVQTASEISDLLNSPLTEGDVGDVASALPNPGDQSIVGVSSDGSGHVFNAVNIDGTVWYIDGQSGVVSTDIGEVLSASGYGPGDVIGWWAI
jgi:hypothetical protein